ncbi:AAA family ATPase [Microcella sp.]|uniref:AAA family ATPase n=1 Tax=Microcella sp. TaxID=1913979 RepID=UPI003F6F474C
MTVEARATRWCVITGGPSCGKSTMVRALAGLGHRTTHEEARHYIDLQRIEGRTIEQIRSRQREFQRSVLQMQLETEAQLDPDELVFLDRALPDSLAYYRFLGLDPDPLLLDALERVAYRTAFLLDLLPLHRDYARTEDEPAQRRIHELIGEVYRELGVPIVRVPVLPEAERVRFVLQNVGIAAE